MKKYTDLGFSINHVLEFCHVAAINPTRDQLL